MHTGERPKLVAETDASGDVAYVWLAMPSWKHARPVDADQRIGNLVAISDVYGASRQAVQAWLATAHPMCAPTPT